MDISPRFAKTRIAPTPSGYLHLGNAYSFLLTQQLAQQTGAKLLLRIDDLDRERIADAYVQDIFDTLHFLEIGWDEGPQNMQEYKEQYSQLHRLSLYNRYLQQLQESGQLFACTCSRAQVLQHDATGIYPGTCRNKQIPLDTPGVNWRLYTDTTKTLSFRSIDDKIVMYTLPPVMNDFVVRKKDGYPAYQLASLADDLHFGIDLIVRGEDLLDSTLAQLYLADVLNEKTFQSACFHHHPLLTDTTGAKLSKSDGALSIQYLRKQGKSKEDVVKMIGNI